MPVSGRLSSPSSSNVILFDQCKNEEFNLLAGFRQLHRHIRSLWRAEIHSGDEISDDSIRKCRIFVLACPRAKFTEDEFVAMRRFVQSGGSLLVLGAEGGEDRNGTNVNFLLEEFGIALKNDCVIRTVFHKYFDPKEALVPNGVLNRTIPSVAGVQRAQKTTKEALWPTNAQQKRTASSRGAFAGALQQKDDEDEEAEGDVRWAF